MTNAQQLVSINQPQLMEDAKQTLSGKWGLAVAAFLVYFLVAMVGGLVPFLSLFISGPLAVGVAGFSLKLAREEPAEVSNIFDGFQNFGNALAAYLLMMVAIMVGFLLLIVPGVILAFGLSQTMFILSDEPQIGPVDALKKSWAMMDGHKMDYFILGLRFIPWILLTILTLFIGMLWLAPYMQVTFANFYRALRADDPVDPLDDDITQHLVE